MKLTLEQLKEVLKHVGLEAVEVVANEAEADKVEVDAILSTVDNARKPVLEAIFKTEKEKEIESAITGKTLGAMRSYLSKTFGIKTADLAGLEKEELVSKAMELANAKYGQDTEGLRKELTEAIENHNTILTEKEQEWATKEQGLIKKYIDRDVLGYSVDITSKIPRKGGDLSFIAGQIKQYAESQYNLHYDEEGKRVAIRTKEDPNTPALNATKTKEITYEDIAREYLTKVDNLAASTAHINPKDAMNNQQQQSNQNNNQFQVSNSLADKNAALLAAE